MFFYKIINLSIIYLETMNNLYKVNEMFNYIDNNINKETIMKGGSNDTQPYSSFRSGLNSIYDYFSVIFTTNKKNNEKYQTSIDDLDKTCDCSKYKCKKEDYENYTEVEDEENAIENINTQKIESQEETVDDSIKTPLVSKLQLKNSKIE